jgi:SAM-dependent methyltransferase
MREASKTSAVRGAELAPRYFAGRVLDIGAGDDPVVPHATPFDREHGDANRADAWFPAASFDCVHSSHCLEHMTDPPDALARWWSLVAPGGHLIVVVPDEDLYEQGYWPSLFNPEHTATFRVGAGPTWSPRSFQLEALARALPGGQVVAIERHARGYVHQRPLLRVAVPRRIVDLANRARPGRRRPEREGSSIDRAFVRACRMMNVPIDQTRGGALAQIQVIVRKDPR